MLILILPYETRRCIYEKIGVNAICMCVTEDGIWFVQGMCPILYFYDIKINEITKAEAMQLVNHMGKVFFTNL